MSARIEHQRSKYFVERVFIKLSAFLSFLLPFLLLFAQVLKEGLVFRKQDVGNVHECRFIDAK